MASKPSGQNSSSRAHLPPPHLYQILLLRSPLSALPLPSPPFIAAIVFLHGDLLTLTREPLPYLSITHSRVRIPTPRPPACFSFTSRTTELSLAHSDQTRCSRATIPPSVQDDQHHTPHHPGYFCSVPQIADPSSCDPSPPTRPFSQVNNLTSL
jgi:hypothetical protein